MLYLCLFFPASISILISEKLQKEKRKLSELVIPYFAYTFMIATIMNMIINFTSTSKTPWYDISIFTFQFTMEYTWLSFIIAVALPCLVYMASKVIQINIEVKENKKYEDIQKGLKNYKRKH